MVAAYLISLLGGMNVRGIRPLYYLQALILLVNLILVLKTFDEPRIRKVLRIRMGLVRSIKMVFEKGVAMKRWIIFDSLSKIPHYVASSIYVPLFAAKVKGADQYVLGIMGTSLVVAPLLLSIPIGRWADRIGRKRVIYFLVAVYCASLIMLVYAPNAQFLIISAILQGFSEVLAVVRGAMTAELVPPYLLGSTHGVLGFFRGLNSLIVPIIAGIIWDALGPVHVFTFIIATQILGVLLLLTVPETLHRS
ncbi:hypothetical protein PYJP_08170 [Pyrofollis japonicus]|nr:hypothetical protein PYJP_08170 [Pyrofollis japonicus]